MIKVIDKLSSYVFQKIAAAIPVTSDRGWYPAFLNFPNAAKERINNDTALGIAAVFGCIRNISEDTGRLPLKVYRKEGRNKIEQPDHPIYNLLQFQPNPEMTAMNFRETLTAHRLGWGNGYAEIQRNLAGEPVALWPLRPDRVTIYRDKSRRIFYRVTNEKGGEVDIWAEDILHMPGLGFDGIKGYNTIQIARESMGAAMAAERFGAAFFGNGCHAGGNLKHPQNLSKEAAGRLKIQIADQVSGMNKHKILVLEEGM